MPFSFHQALEYIHSFDDPYLAALRDHGRQTWGLAKIRDLLGRMGNPHLAYPTIHVAGTKGKGSVSAMIAQVLSESGLRTGLYTSPHLQDWRERIQIDRRFITKRAVRELADDLRARAEKVPGLSAFEVTTAVAFWYFARKRVDIAVIEVGLGGRLDATIVVEPAVSVITSISLDHTQLLGDTVADIAGEKAAIIKAGVPVVSAPQPQEAEIVIAQYANKMGSQLVLVGRDWRYEILDLSLGGSVARIGDGHEMGTFKIGLPGTFQVENAAVALAALSEAQHARIPVTEEGRRKGLSKAKWAGRFEIMQRMPLVILDGAHNPYSVEQLVINLGLLSPATPMTVVFGCMADKDIDGMLRILFQVADRIIFTRAETGRAASTRDLLDRANRILSVAAGQAHRRLELLEAERVPDAVETVLALSAKDELICVTGSLSVVGEARQYLGERVHESNQPALSVKVGHS